MDAELIELRERLVLAEALAERTAHELRERERELALLAATAVAANRAGEPEAALGAVLAAICDHLGWVVGLAWLPEGDALHCAAVTCTDEARFAPFLAASRASSFARGEGLPGRAWATGAPSFSPDISADPTLPRAAAAGAAGVRAALAHPVVVGGELVAVLECFADAELATEPLVAVLGHVGEQVARVFERAATERRARHDARHDQLTGLPNRAWFVAELEALTGAEVPLPAAVAIIDLDRFKEVNDTLGHAYGDELLRAVGERLRGAVRETDTIARLGGDEFGLVLPRVCDPAVAAAAADRIAAALRRPFVLDGVLTQVDASVGIAYHPRDATDPTALMRCADVAMYEAKRTHAGHVGFAPELDRNSAWQLELVAELRQALEQDQLTVHFQPKLDAEGGRVLGMEALVRWSHPARGTISPAEFLPTAERTGLIKPLTSIVLEASLAQARAWRELGRWVPVAVNVSARSLLDDGFVDEVRGRLATAGLPAALLELEVTETTMFEDPERCRATLERLSALGVTIAVDDFGTGYSSLAQLKQLPVGTLKIDRCFVAGMVADRRDASIVRTTIALAHELGLVVVAEGVEDERTLERLAHLGCDAAQGFHLCRPGTAADITAWLVARDDERAAALA